ncbi:hypothetical protein K3G63_03470 [Hymenobacter sp. HSC-4F20]|uniref:type VI secretion system tube protein TssD n=1 Tax=Hymenobacter sp. HSC-4F20 TaxID=2864135 RepID=UPI001C73BF07|nr:type VI secretion system tube protein TssD [Hymenobacter sp. HSC-4F20]MBX0289479.1 hypothetical protein [Hymenobacter sp. HSC-4F20]
MTYINAELRLAGQTYPLAACSFGFRQYTDARGRPNSKVVGLPLELLLEGDEGPELAEWATSPGSLRSGEVVFYPDDPTHPRRTLAFADARCVQQRVQLVPGQGAAAYQCLLVLSAQQLELDGQVLEQRWNRRPNTRAVAQSPKARLAAAPPARGGGLIHSVKATRSNALLDDLQGLVGPGLDVRKKLAVWVAGGLDEHKVLSALRGSVDKLVVFQRLSVAADAPHKGLYEQRVIIDDYQNIPGVTKAPYVENGLPPLPIPASLFGVADPAFDLPARNAPTFTKYAQLREVMPGEKLYRVTNDPLSDPYAMTGGYWTRTLPAGLNEVIGGTAVMPEWNNFQRVYEFTAPPYADPVAKEPKFHVWEGPTAAQPVSGIYPDKINNGYCLQGGEPQVFITNNLSRSPDFKNHIRDITPLHKSW